MRVALVYNLKKNPQIEGVALDYYSEFDSPDTLEAMARSLSSCGYTVSLVEADKNIFERLRLETPELVFNIAEGLSGPSRESQIPAILDYLKIPYTGSGAVALALSLDKGISKTLFAKEGIPTPRFQMVKDENLTVKKDLTFPLIVKPNSEGSAKGITKDSVVCNKSRLQQEIRRIRRDYRQDVLVEEFIDGKELTVAILGNAQFLDLPILEIDFSNCKDSGEHFYSWRMKEYQGNEELGLTPEFYCPARLDEATAERVKKVAYRAHQVIGCKDFSRVDIRLSRDNVPYALEINPLPGLDPKDSNFPIMAKQAGIDYNRLLKIIVNLAILRYNNKKSAACNAVGENSTTTYANIAKGILFAKTKGGKDAIKW